MKKSPKRRCGLARVLMTQLPYNWRMKGQPISEELFGFRNAGSAAKGIYVLAVIVFFLSVMWNCREAYGSEVLIRPSVTVSEEYDDNIYLTRDNRVYDFITRAIPSMSITYKTPIWDLGLNETFYWWYYAKKASGYYSNDAKMTSKLSVIKNLLYFDVTDMYSSVVLNPRGPSTSENLNVNRTDTNVLNASPYVKYQLDPVTDVTAGYVYTNIWYRNSEGINRQQHKGFLSIRHAFNPKIEAEAGAEYVADRPEETEPNNDQTAVFSSITYNIDPRMKVDGTAGYRMFRFSEGPDDDRPFYNIGFTYRLPQKGSVELRCSQLFTVSPTEGIVEQESQRLTATYGEEFSVSGSVYHSRDKYIEIGQTNEALGVQAGFIYAPNIRRAYRVSGGYERDKYNPGDDKRNIYAASAGIDHKLTSKAVLSLDYTYNKSTGQLDADNYFDNNVRVQLRIEI